MPIVASILRQHIAVQADVKGALQSVFNRGFARGVRATVSDISDISDICLPEFTPALPRAPTLSAISHLPLAGIIGATGGLIIGARFCQAVPPVRV